MKNIILLIIFLNSSAFADNIVELYNDLGKSQKPQYKIIKKEGKFGSMEICEDFTPVRVDLKNGFIHIDNDCPGDGNYVTEIGLFRMKTGQPILVINSMLFWSGRIDETKLEIFRQEAPGKWVKVKLSPEPDAKLFQLKMPKKTKRYFPILFVAGVPKVGTDLHVYLQAGGVSAIKKRYRIATEEESENEWKKGY